MTAELPRLHGLSEAAKYDRLVEARPDLWWGEGPFTGLHQLNQVRVEYFREAFGGFRGKRILDVGCGGGILAEALAREGARVTGLDPSERSLAAARDHAAKAGLDITYVAGSAERLPDVGSPFDLVTAVDVLEHVADLERTAGEIARVLAAGGGLGFLTHNRTPAAFLSLIWQEEYVEHTMPEGFHDFSRFITPEELEDVLTRHGLVVQEVQGVVRAEGDPSGRRTLSRDLGGTYLGWAIKRQS